MREGGDEENTGDVWCIGKKQRIGMHPTEVPKITVLRIPMNCILGGQAALEVEKIIQARTPSQRMRYEFDPGPPKLFRTLSIANI
eukprot:1146452-Pelagomonas_calceolata.AAC.3